MKVLTFDEYVKYTVSLISYKISNAVSSRFIGVVDSYPFIEDKDYPGKISGYFRVDKDSKSHYYLNNNYLFSLEFEDKNLYSSDEEVKKIMLLNK